MNLQEASLQVNSRTFKLCHVELENAILAFFFEDHARMGTVAIAMPGFGETAAGRSSILVGSKYMMSTRALAEKLAGKTGKVTIISLYTMLDETEALQNYSKLLDKV